MVYEEYDDEIIHNIYKENCNMWFEAAYEISKSSGRHFTDISPQEIRDYINKHFVLKEDKNAKADT